MVGHRGWAGRGLLALLGIGALLVAAAGRADHIRGIQATIISINQVTFDVTFQVTMYTDGPTMVGTTTSLGTPGYGVNAIEYGDGSTISTTTITATAAGPPGVYQRTFTHTYPDATDRTIRVGTTCCAGYTDDPSNTGIAGNVFFGFTTTNGVRYQAGFTNTLFVDFDPLVPVAPEAMLFVLALGLFAGGAFLLRRRQAAA